jgi:spore germination protein PC
VNQYDFYEYIHKLHRFVETQDRKLKQLEQLVRTLEEDINQLKSKPSIQVEKIEYKFDQLKVETLEGTLNIGLNPTDLQGIEDFAVAGQQVANQPLSPAAKFQSNMRIEEPILQSLESEVSSVIQKYESEKNIKVDDSYITFILGDIKRQLPSRIEYYLNQIPNDQRVEEQMSVQENRIVELIKNDIQKGIITFLETNPIDKKG